MTTLKTHPLSDWLERCSPQIEQSLREALEHPTLQAAPQPLKSALAAALLSGGKRMRPAFCRLACEAEGGSWKDAEPAAVAVEMIHAYSLVHDDLPCMDDDALRRGQPTVHVQFGEATAVLVGDALQTAAFGHLARCSNPERAPILVEALATASGAVGMVGGQQLDMNSETQVEESLADIQAIHEAKTGALLSASFCLGAISAGADVSSWNMFGDAVGALFQATDDLLDATSSTEVLGKTAGKDQVAGKATLVSALGLEGARKHADQLAASANAALDTLNPQVHRELLHSIPQALLNRCR